MLQDQLSNLIALNVPVARTDPGVSFSLAVRAPIRVPEYARVRRNAGVALAAMGGKTNPRTCT